jgi:hypothetical protein
MVKTDYKRARVAAAKELEQLLVVQQKTEQRIVHLRNMISALDALLNPSRANTADALGLTEAIRSLFKSLPPDAGILSATEVRQALEAMGFDSSKYSNFLASIHVVLRRLRAHGEIRKYASEKGVKGFTRVSTLEEELSE